MDLFAIARRIADAPDMNGWLLRRVASNSWFHITYKKNLPKILKEGLIKGNNALWDKTGDGIYLVDSWLGTNNYLHHGFESIDFNDLAIIEVSGLSGKFLMDEDNVNGGDIGSPPSEEFADLYPDSYIKMDQLIENGTDPTDAILQVIDQDQIAPNMELMDSGQGGINALTARFVGKISPSSIVKVYEYNEEAGDWVSL